MSERRLLAIAWGTPGESFSVVIQGVTEERLQIITTRIASMPAVAGGDIDRNDPRFFHVTVRVAKRFRFSEPAINAIVGMFAVLLGADVNDLPFRRPVDRNAFGVSSIPITREVWLGMMRGR